MSIHKSMLLWILPLLIGLALFVAQAKAASSTVKIVQTGTDRVLRILKNSDLNAEKRRQKIRGVVDEYFDFEEMSRRVLGPAWNDQPAQKQQEFARAFSDFLFSVYIDKIEKYTDEKITYKQQNVQDEFATVDALIIRSQGQEIPLEYRLEKKSQDWKVYDVVVEGISLIQNYRSQIRSLLSRKSMDEVIAQLKKKDAKLQ